MDGPPGVNFEPEARSYPRLATDFRFSFPTGPGRIDNRWAEGLASQICVLDVGCDFRGFLQHRGDRTILLLRKADSVFNRLARYFASDTIDQFDFRVDGRWGGSAVGGVAARSAWTRTSRLVNGSRFFSRMDTTSYPVQPHKPM